jgi:hypothetical protein
MLDFLPYSYYYSILLHLLLTSMFEMVVLYYTQAWAEAHTFKLGICLILILNKLGLIFRNFFVCLSNRNH